MEEHNGKVPQNARININYRGKKPKVSFKYPVDKKNSKTVGSMCPFIMLIWIAIFCPGCFLMDLFNMPEKAEETRLPFNRSENYNVSSMKGFMEYYLQEERVRYYQEHYSDMQEKNIIKILRQSLSVRTICFLVILFGWMPIYFPFKKKWDSKYPDFMAWIARKKYRKFTKKDLQKKDREIFIELPVFNNVVCDFEATKDFSKYLTEFDIREHKFKYYIKRKCKKTKNKKRFNNETIFYARWYFKEKPEKGYLDVVFK